MIFEPELGGRLRSLVDLQRSLPESSTYTTWEARKLRNPAPFQQADSIEMCEYVVYYDRACNGSSPRLKSFFVEDLLSSVAFR